jgi:hypothetical protein
LSVQAVELLGLADLSLQFGKQAVGSRSGDSYRNNVTDLRCFCINIHGLKPGRAADKLFRHATGLFKQQFDGLSDTGFGKFLLLLQQKRLQAFQSLGLTLPAPDPSGPHRAYPDESNI